MYIRSQDRNSLINFDKFHQLTLDEENLQINAIFYNGDNKVVTPLGCYKTLERAKSEYEDIMDSLLDETIGIHEVE